MISKSREVLLDCCLSNGTIVAANSDRPDYPHDVQNYRYVWPRDSAYICHALEILGNTDEQLAYFRWLKRLEDIESGLLFQNYYVNGRKRWLSFQPDQNGSTLWVLCNFVKAHPEHKLELMPKIKLFADGICSVWTKDYFNIQTQDLWEWFYTYPEMKTTFTYSLAACAHGLSLAYSLVKDKKYFNVSTQMIDKIKNSVLDGIILRRDGLIHDRRADISVLGLVWPFEIFKPDDEVMIGTIRYIHENLEEKGHFHRHAFDDYDSFKFQANDARRGGGTWPIATLWMSIYYSLKGEKKKAKKYYDNVITRLDENKNIPEQFFENDIQVSVKPLAWSHAMQIVAYNFLTKN